RRAAAHAGAAWHRVRAIQSPRQGLPDGHDRREDDVRELRFPQPRATLYARGSEVESGAGGGAARDRETEEGDACADRARLAAGFEAMDCADPGHDQAGSPGREHRGSGDRTELRGSAHNRERRLTDHDPGGALPRTPGEKDRSLTLRIGILGSGLMGAKLGTIWARAGHEVVFSYARSEQKLKKLAREAQGNARAGTPGEA